MDFDGLRLERLAVVGDDGMVNITMSDPGEPRRRAVLVYDRENDEFFDAYLRDGSVHALSDAEAHELLARAGEWARYRP